jgi:hypothetical protein
MKARVLVASALVVAVLAPLTAHAQGIPGGVAHGIYEGNRRAGPVGAVVGAAVGGVVGGIEGALGVEHSQASYAAPADFEPLPRPAHRHKKLRANSR